jgi:hypothetical protein
MADKPKKKSKDVPVYTPGSPGVASKKVPPADTEGVDVFSAYTGKKLPKLPDMDTPSDNPAKPGSTYHGGLYIEDEDGSFIMAHKNTKRRR